MTKLTYIQQQEKLAMAGDRNAVMEVVSALRKYRELVTSIPLQTGLYIENWILDKVNDIEENNS